MSRDCRAEDEGKKREAKRKKSGMKAKCTAVQLPVLLEIGLDAGMKWKWNWNWRITNNETRRGPGPGRLPAMGMINEALHWPDLSWPIDRDPSSVKLLLR